jgi:serine phosphatase RsbU (regulator of sigma subunit)
VASRHTLAAFPAASTWRPPRRPLLAPAKPLGQTVGVEPTREAITVLVVEDDEGDALLVAELLEDGFPPMAILRSRTLAEALAELERDQRTVDCVLLDLGLPDAVGLDALARVRVAAPAIAVIVLTGLDDEAAGVAAVNAGAQDYLVKGQVDAGLLTRAVRYAIGRRQAEDHAQLLRIAAVRAEENARLERGLVPSPIVAGQSIWIASKYRPGRRRALLGGDFYDVVERADGGLHVLVGDVCGHGPDEAALGACLRIAWRALTLSGAGGDLMLNTLQRVLEHESQIPGLFATLCTLEIEPCHRAVGMRRAGHPPPVLIDGSSVTSLPIDGGGPPIGLFADEQWPQTRLELPVGWVMLLYTDGLIEGRVGPGPERLGEHRLRELIARHVAESPDWAVHPEGLLSDLLARVDELNGDELSDDVAMLLVGTRPRPPRG